MPAIVTSHDAIGRPGVHCGVSPLSQTTGVVIQKMSACLQWNGGSGLSPTLVAGARLALVRGLQALQDQLGRLSPLYSSRPARSDPNSASLVDQYGRGLLLWHWRLDRCTVRFYQAAA